MSAKQFLLELVFRGNSAQAKAAATEVQTAVAGVSAEAEKATKAAGRETTATKKNTDAKKQAAQAAREQAAAEKAARESAARPGTGVGPAGQGMPAQPVPSSVPAPKTSQTDLDDIRAKYVPIFAVQRTYQKELEEIAKHERSGALTAEEFAAAQARVRASYDRSVEAIKRSDTALQGNTRTMKLQAHESRVLSYQVTDTFQSLALGMPPLQVLMQQGPQVVDVFGGMGNALRYMRQFLSPVRVGLGLLGAAVVTVASSWSGYLKSTKAVEVAHAGLGRGLASSSSQLEAVARAGATAAGISIKSARSMEVQFLRTGRIGAEHYDDLIGLSKDFAATLGLEQNAAGAQLAEMFAEPAKAAETLYQKYGLIDAATMRYAQTLVAQNRESDAQAVLLDALPDKLADAESGMHALDRAMQRIKNTASGLWDGIGEGIDNLVAPPTEEELLAIARQRLALSGRKSRGGNSTAVEGERASAQAEIDALEAIIALESLLSTKKADRREAEIKGQNALEIAGGSGATSRMRREEELKNQIAALEAGIAAPGQDSVQQSEIQQALEAKQRVLDALINSQQRLNELDRLDAQIAAERNPVLRAEMEARRTLLEMADQEVSQTEIDMATRRARQKVIEQTLATGQTQISDLRAETDIRMRLTEQVAAGIIKAEDVNRLLQEELTLRPLVAAAAAAEGDEKVRLSEITDQLRQAYADQAAADRTADRASKLREYSKAQQESLADLRLEQMLLGQSEAIRSRTLALFEAEKKIRELGLSGKQADQIRDEAAKMADLRTEIDRMADAWDRVGSAAEAAIDGSIDKLLEGDFSGALEGFADEIRGMLTDIAIKNPLKNAILGTNGGTIGDVGGLGGIWGRLMGKGEVVDPAHAARSAAQSIATMRVTASSVTISTMGTLGGLGGLGAAAPLTTGGMRDGVLSLSAADIVNLKKTVATEWVPSAGDGQAEGIIDTIMNRMASGKWGDTVAGVVNARSQFSDINGPVAWANGRSSVDDIPMSQVSAKIDAVVDNWLIQRAGGMSSSVGDHLSYANPKFSDASNMSWISQLQGPSLGAGDATHQHGTPEWLEGMRPGAFGISLPGSELQGFSDTIKDATQNLGTLGGGFDVFGQALAGIGQGGGAGGGLFGSFLGSVLGGIGVPGFEIGGATGGSDPKKVAGVVHQKEYVFDAASTARIGVGNLEAIRRGTMKGYAKGGYVSAASAYPFLTAGAANSAPQNVVQLQPVLVNNTSVPMAMEVEETTDARGQRQQSYILAEATATGLSGGAAKRQMRSTYGLRQRGTGRG
ncbi:Prophage tail length tape measure protein [Aquimixticola soesokkakensis]|uniref:Prophage tail length tape measure protein n=1 Tax=Aquimixticola soesokkakensis TaxID=1519096 RepID=A0A1Y5SEV1_9RHOB|nr:phage tail length tape measure family protein [Aquimixticola soesokkakensis]SLN37987.1 Prophage tail length tape measure protein [Aquimixticola soesokkakensis]